MSDDPNELFGGSSSPSGEPTSTVNTFFVGVSELSHLAYLGENGNKYAAYKIHQYYEFSDYDRKKSEYWLNLAADLDHGEAQYSLAIELLQNGRYTEALAWCKKAISNGESEAKELLEEIKEIIR